MGFTLPLTYTRPKHVDQASTRASMETDASRPAISSDGSIKSGRSNLPAGVPESLAFDKIMKGGTCPPVTVRDFMNYLIYIEHAAENLQFHLWYVDYIKRFESASTADLALSPVWTSSMQAETVARLRKDRAEKLRYGDSAGAAADIIRGTGLDNNHNGQPVQIPQRPSSGANSQDAESNASTAVPSNSSFGYKSQAADAFVAAGAKQPFTIQPFRDEINRVIATYIMDDAPRQLNLSSAEQKAAVQALSYTTHPSALRSLADTTEATLRSQAHPNFVRWSICNGNPARVLFARSLGVGLIAAGVAVGVVLTLSGVPRGYRALSAIALVLGISTLVAAYKGMCVVLHGMHHRHVRPWELFPQGDEESDQASVTVVSASDRRRSNNNEKLGRSFESFGSCNSYEDEPWVVRYEKRNVIRKIFDREVWIQEPALRQIQDTIFVQAMLAALLLGGALTAVFVAVPGVLLQKRTDS